MSITPHKDPLEAPSKERLRLWLRFLKASRSIETTLRENFKADFNTTLPRFDVLAALSRYADGLKMSQISGVLKVSNGNVTGIVDRLAEEGLLVRVSVQGDRRASLVRLTQRGQEEFARQAVAHEGWVNDMLSGFDAEMARALADDLQALETSLAAEPDSDG
ncbi:MarR family winged helix-turn-helix transcriptional regulator [Actibacterium sp. 188UL27-1]|uniref:MarR family winged helix-turn-helix transcriptional regulator n=1 Tax=Actibacterium sp. 188UL27-1 TaxID=2786961 RepID=UPI00195B72F0|nr:MarR family transcriptional regulator [Actibacterium sp. 188UL27-1]MBM7067019.1 MarR family transcriptional regulator [Actibacterium sp. 188UL27-1]